MPYALRSRQNYIAKRSGTFSEFPDSFEFIGSLGAINNQIGNAVPPLLAYQIAKNIPFKGQFVDLFCGAGGLALGFIWDGWTPIIGNDIDNYAVETHKRNLGGEAIVGDINSQEVHDAIVDAAVAAKKANPNLPLFVLGDRLVRDSRPRIHGEVLKICATGYLSPMPA